MPRKLTAEEHAFWREKAALAYRRELASIDGDHHPHLKSLAGNQARRDYEFVLDEIDRAFRA